MTFVCFMSKWPNNYHIDVQVHRFSVLPSCPINLGFVIVALPIVEKMNVQNEVQLPNPVWILFDGPNQGFINYRNATEMV